MTCNFNILWDETDATKIVLRDVGPWDRFKTVTNDAERVIDRLMEDRLLKPGRRVFYYDSENKYAEIVWQDVMYVEIRHAERSTA